ncbi:MAG: hypothetical protein PHH28_16095, partial [Desulfuromonadaceae bacterium]|nr:hypothetical protein [Desulfuromonadaceae bacterium]
MKLFVYALFVGVLAGCVHSPTAAERASADYGSYPSNYQALVQQYLYAKLKDPSSVMYNNWRSPARSYDGQYSGYRVCVDVNS